MTAESQTSNGPGAAASVADRPAAPTTTKLACSVIIPVHNKVTLTRACVNALLSDPDVGVEREIIVVDDGSADLTPQLLEAFGDRIRVVRNDRPLGFAGACTAGIAAASHPNLVLLNNDTIPTFGWLSALARYAIRHPEAAVIGAKLLYPNDTIQHAGVVIGQNGFPQHIYLGFPSDHPAVNRSRRFPIVTAACCLIRREDWDAMGGFDPAFHNGWEDVDFCLRLGEAGREVHYCHDSVVYHFESTTRDPAAPDQRPNIDRYTERWSRVVHRDDFEHYLADGLIEARYPHRYPIQLSISPLLAGVAIDDNKRIGDQLLFDRAKQVAVLLRNNILLNVRVQEAELRAQVAEARLREAEARLAAGGQANGHAAVADEPSAGGAPADDDGAERAVEQALAETPAADKPAAQPILGRIERPGRTPDVVTENTITASGWAVSRAGIFAVKMLIDGVERATADYGGPRPDVLALFPDYPEAERSGFIGEAPVGDLPDGFHSLTIRIIGRDGAAAEVTTTFERDSTAFSTGRILVRTDKPAAGTQPTVRDRLFVQGWALSSRGVRSVTPLIDGEPRTALPYGLLRPDVGGSHPEFPDADHCGFCGIVPIDGLGDGAHELTLRIAAGEDLSHDLALPFIVDTSQPPFGETPDINRQYPEWLAKFAPTEASLAPLRAEATALAYQPAFTFVLATGDAEPGAVAATIDSVVAQAYPNWRLLVAVSPDTAETLRADLADRATRDPRIEVVATPAGSTSDAFAAALERTSGDYVALVPAGDIVWPSALAAVVRDLQTSPDADVVYGDEDKIDLDAGAQWDPFFKPDWSPDLLLSSDYFGPLTFYRTALARDLGGLRAGFDGAETYDLALRATEQEVNILHVPKLLLSRRAVMAPEPAPPAPDTVAGQRAALEAAMARRSLAATIEAGISPGRWRVRYALPETPGVTIVMPSGGKMQYLRPCLDDLIDRTTYPNLHILVLDNSDSFEVAALCDELALRFPRLRRVPVELKPFNFSALINRALPFVDTPYVILLNDDITVVTPDWVEAMLEHAQRPEVGVVGPKLLYPDGTLQHVGVVLGPFDGTVHAFKQFPGDTTGWFGLPNVIRNYSAVTFACAMMRTSLFAEVGGLDEENLPIAFNDVDFCLRVIEAGYRVVYTPHAVLYHHESVTKKAITNPSEVARLRGRWGHVIAHDPFYSPNLTRMGEDCSLNMG